MVATAATATVAAQVGAVSLDVTLLLADEASALSELLRASIVIGVAAAPSSSAVSTTVTAASTVRRAAPAATASTTVSSAAVPAISVASAVAALVGPVALLAALPALVLAGGAGPSAALVLTGGGPGGLHAQVVALEFLSVHGLDGGVGVLGLLVVEESVLALHDHIADGAELVEPVLEVVRGDAPADAGDVHLGRVWGPLVAAAFGGAAVVAHTLIAVAAFGAAVALLTGRVVSAVAAGAASASNTGLLLLLDGLVVAAVLGGHLGVCVVVGVMVDVGGLWLRPS